MRRTQIDLSEPERQDLQVLRTGHSQSDLIREAVDSCLEPHQPEGRLACLHQAQGLWADRDDQPSSSDLCRQLDRLTIAGPCWPIRSPRPCWWWIPTFGTGLADALIAAISRCWPRCWCPTPSRETTRAPSSWGGKSNRVASIDSI